MTDRTNISVDGHQYQVYTKDLEKMTSPEAQESLKIIAEWYR